MQNHGTEQRFWGAAACRTGGGHGGKKLEGSGQGRIKQRREGRQRSGYTHSEKGRA